jgi:hypothetical protein
MRLSAVARNVRGGTAAVCPAEPGVQSFATISKPISGLDFFGSF